MAVDYFLKIDGIEGAGMRGPLNGIAWKRISPISQGRI
jgi:hypothetical protein